MKLIRSPLALERVGEIAAYVSAERPRAAESWVEDIFGAVEELEPFPLCGRIVPVRNRKDVREVIHGEYRSIYRVETSQLSVLTVRHALQLLER
jgi:toxin ParE1/3/4